MPKAKSRLQLTKTRFYNFQNNSTPKTSTNLKVKSREDQHLNDFLIWRLLKKYIQHLMTLIISLPFYFLSWQVLHRNYPWQIQNTLFKNSYLYLMLPFFMANVFFLSFLLLSGRRGLLLASLINILLSLHLQKILLTWQIVLGIICFFVIMEIVLTYFDRKKNENIK